MTHETPRHRLALVGDDLIAGGRWAEWFPDDEVLEFGAPGETTDDLLARLDDVVAADPDEVVLLIGTNDFGARRSVERVVRGVETIMVELRKALPSSRLLLVSIPPRGREIADGVRDANRHLWQFVATVRGQYLDLWPALAREDGEIDPEYSPDRLHLNEAGYQAWLA